MNKTEVIYGILHYCAYAKLKTQPRVCETECQLRSKPLVRVLDTLRQVVHKVTVRVRLSQHDIITDIDN